MNVQEWLSLLWEQVAATGIIQWIALLLGVSEVLLARANNIALYPTGIAATALSIFILYEAGLYAECLLYFYYIVMSIYGWWYWVKKKDRPPVEITRCSRREWMIVLLISGGGFALLYTLLTTFTSSTVPAWDAWVSATAWAGMWLLAKRKVENWILLNISNAFAIPLFISKELPLYAALTIFLFIVAIIGYRDWLATLRKKEREQRPLQKIFDGQ